jgi:hypothetical protein
MIYIFFFKFDDEIDIIRQKTVFFIIFSVNDYRVLYNNAVRPLIVRDMLGFRVMVFNATFNNISVSGRRGRDRRVVGFTTTYTISAYHH